MGTVNVSSRPRRSAGRGMSARNVKCSVPGGMRDPRFPGSRTAPSMQRSHASVQTCSGRASSFSQPCASDASATKTIAAKTRRVPTTARA